MPSNAPVASWELQDEKLATAHHHSTDSASTPQDPAARYEAFEKNLSFFEALRLYWRAVLWIIYGQLVVFGYGIDGVVAANIIAIPRFQKDYGTSFTQGVTVSHIIPANWLAIFSGVSLLTAMIGALAAGELADRIGRRPTNLLFCLISVGGVAPQFWSHGSLAILTVGKAINGFSVGAWLVIGPLYASEVAPLPLKSVMTAMTNIVQLSGVVMFTGIVYAVGSGPGTASYQIPIACQWIIPGLVIFTVWFWPESPVWLIRQNKKAAAVSAARKLYGSDSTVDKEGLLAHIEATIQAEAKTSPPTYLDCFHRDARSRTLICMFVYACQYIGGVVFVLGYQSYFYELLGYPAKKSFELSMINNALQWIANVCSWFLLTTLGQRKMIVWGQLFGAVCLLTIGGLSTRGTQAADLAVVVFIFVWSFTYQLTLGAAAWSVVASVPSVRLRSRTQGLSNLALCFTQWVVTFTFPYMFNPDKGNLQGKVGFVFGSTTLVGFLGVFFWLPETRRSALSART